MSDLLFLALGYAVMLKSGKSVWSPLIDGGSFIVASSLIISQPVNSWPRRVGMLQFGVHLAQLTTTDKNTNAE